MRNATITVNLFPKDSTAEAQRPQKKEEYMIAPLCDLSVSAVD